MTRVSVLVLAAGQGTRMKSALPKVLHPVGGRPLLSHVLQAAQGVRPASMAVVVGSGRDHVQSVMKAEGWGALSVVVQPEQRGSGHAVRMATSWLKRQRGTILVVYGDTPLLTTATLKALLREHLKSRNAATFLAMDLADPTGYGRMVTDRSGAVERIVEDRDATADERRITVVNSGVACWDVRGLLRALPRLRPDNAKKEFYLTDAAAMLRAEGGRVGLVITPDPDETHGVNTRVDLAEAEAIFRRRILTHWMREGVTIVDPATTYVDAAVRLAADVVLQPGTVLRGTTRIDSGAEIGPFTVVEDATIGAHAHIGPFARVRPGSVIGPRARIGNFVETKKARIADGAKVNHLSYIGDARVGAAANIGAGTITCNYNGFQKFETRIGERAFIGSNTNLVAPVTVGAGAIVAAGSTITQSVPDGALGLARSRQTNIKGWAHEFRKKQSR